MTGRRAAILRASAAIGLMAALACGPAGYSVAPVVQLTPGTYSGTDSSGGLLWTLAQSGTAVTGTGTFLATGTTTTVSYTLRGTFVDGELELRLVGAPGDTDADSVWFGGRAVTELYTGAAFSGTLNGPTATLAGPLSMYITESQ